MIDNIFGKIESQPRVLQYKEKDNTRKFITPWLVTYGPGYEEAVEKSKEMNIVLKRSDVWKKKVEEGEVKEIVKVVAKRGPNLADLLLKRKKLALEGFDENEKVTMPCGRKRCMCCKIVSSDRNVTVNGKWANSGGGSCISKNVVYFMQCKICHEGYCGKTVQHLRERMNEHRSAFYTVLEKTANIESVEVDDTNILGLHLLTQHKPEPSTGRATPRQAMR